MSPYKKEFDSLMRPQEFFSWVASQLLTFINNVDRSNTQTRPLREWVRLFLRWVEYQENNNGNN